MTFGNKGFWREVANAFFGLCALVLLVGSSLFLGDLMVSCLQDPNAPFMMKGFVVIFTGCYITLMFVMGAFMRMKMHDLKQAWVLSKYQVSLGQMLIGEITAYLASNADAHEDGWIEISHFVHWVWEIRKSALTGHVPAAIEELVQAGQIERHYPDSGGLWFRLTEEARNQKVVAIAARIK